MLHQILNAENINSKLFRMCSVYVVGVLLWTLFVGSSVTFANYHKNMSFPLMENVIWAWKILRDIGFLLLLIPSLFSYVVIVRSIVKKKFFHAITIFAQWFLLNALLLFSFAIVSGFLYLLLLLMIHKGV